VGHTFDEFHPESAQDDVKRLWAGLLAEGRARGCAEAWLGTEADNVEANGLYRSAGAGDPSGSWRAPGRHPVLRADRRGRL